MLRSLFDASVNSARRIRVIARFKPFENSTVHGRSQERYRRAFLTTVAAGASRVVSTATALISVPLTFKYLGMERYGLWMTISSIIAILGFSDLGIANGLLNGISEANGKDDRELARGYVSSAFFFLATVAAVIGIGFAVAYRFISWQSVFHVRSPQAIAEAGPAVAAFLACFLIGIPAGIVGRIQTGYQEGYEASLWATAGGISGLIAVLFAIKFHGSLMLLVLAMAGAPILSQILNGVVLFGFQRPWLFPRWAYVTRVVSRALLGTGLSFFLLQIAVAISYSSDNIVLTRILGPEAVTQYSIPSRMFNIVATISAVLLGSLWPAYGEALVRRDIPWIRKTLLRSLNITIGISVPMSLLLVLFGRPILHLWVGSKINPSFVLLLGLGLWSIMASVSSTFATCFNGLSLLSFQVKLTVTGAFLNLALSIWLTHKIGISGVIYGSLCTQALLMIPGILYIRNYLKEA